MGEIILVAAVANRNVIGKDNDLPWGRSYPEDLKHFKNLTLNQTVVMGRKTYDSIISSLGKPLPNRNNIIITSTPIEGVQTYKSLDDLFTDSNDDLFIIGGAKIYEATLPYADKLEITHIQKDYEGDTFFPEIDNALWYTSNEIQSRDLLFRTYLRRW